MPKMKTSKTAAKRFKKTGTGKLRHEQQNNQHKFQSKSSARKHRLDRDADVAPGDVRRVKRMLAER